MSEVKKPIYKRKWIYVVLGLVAAVYIGSLFAQIDTEKSFAITGDVATRKYVLGQYSSAEEVAERVFSDFSLVLSTISDSSKLKAVKSAKVEYLVTPTDKYGNKGEPFPVVDFVIDIGEWKKMSPNYRSSSNVKAQFMWDSKKWAKLDFGSPLFQYLHKNYDIKEK